MPLNWGSGAVEAVIDQKQRTSYHRTYYCLSDREGDCDPPTVTCQCSYWKSPSICCRWGDCEGQVAVFRLMRRSLRSFSLCGPRVLACDVREKGEKKKLSGRLQRDLGNGSVFRRGVRLYYIIGAALHTPFSELQHRLNWLSWQTRRISCEDATASCVRPERTLCAVYSCCEISNVTNGNCVGAWSVCLGCWGNAAFCYSAIILFAWHALEIVRTGRCFFILGLTPHLCCHFQRFTGGK